MTEPLTEDQTTLLNIKKTEYDRKLKSFALDVARTIPSAVNSSVDTLIEAAEKICGYITKSPKEWPIPNADEASAEIEHLKATGEIQ